ncbi:MAG: DUF4258 domain-containing protein [Anaerolineae bacterium]|nr:DUF4258 domain-containing protein [Anaerolineae bacterium]
MSTIKNIRRAVQARKVEFTDHALEEMDNDALNLEQVQTVLLHGALYREHDDDPRGIRYVVRGAVDDEDVDVVCRLMSSGILKIITVYVVKELDENNDE